MDHATLNYILHDEFDDFHEYGLNTNEDLGVKQLNASYLKDFSEFIGLLCLM